MQIQTQQSTNNLNSNNKEEVKLLVMPLELIEKAIQESHTYPKTKYTVDVYA